MCILSNFMLAFGQNV